MIDLSDPSRSPAIDPDSNALSSADIDRSKLRVVVSHELVHALQDQYVHLDSIITQRHANDRRAAAQAILEVRPPRADPCSSCPSRNPNLRAGWFWRQRASWLPKGTDEGIRPRATWLREGLIFPYWVARLHRLVRHKYFSASRCWIRCPSPRSKSCIRALRGARRADDLAFSSGEPDTVQYEDGLAEFETRLLFQQHLGNEAKP